MLLIFSYSFLDVRFLKGADAADAVPRWQNGQRGVRRFTSAGELGRVTARVGERSTAGIRLYGEVDATPVLPFDDGGPWIAETVADPGSGPKRRAFRVLDRRIVADLRGHARFDLMLRGAGPSAPEGLRDVIDGICNIPVTVSWGLAAPVLLVNAARSLARAYAVQSYQTTAQAEGQRSNTAYRRKGPPGVRADGLVVPGKLVPVILVVSESGEPVCHPDLESVACPETCPGVLRVYTTLLAGQDVAVWHLRRSGGATEHPAYWDAIEALLRVLGHFSEILSLRDVIDTLSNIPGGPTRDMADDYLRERSGILRAPRHGGWATSDILQRAAFCAREVDQRAEAWRESLGLVGKSDRVNLVVKQLEMLFGGMQRVTNIYYGPVNTGTLIGNINQTINGLPDRAEHAALTDSLKQLGEMLKQAVPRMPPEAAQQAQRNYDDLAKEAAGPKPRGSIARALTSDIAETVKSVAEFGKPIAELCVAIAALFA